MPTPTISIPELTEKNKINFWRKVDRNGPTMSHMDTPCWTWIAGKSHGYGVFNIGLRTFSSHRVAFVLGEGVFPEDKPDACHHCDNRACVRFDHLFAGSHQDNMEDRERKGRNNPQRGERNGSYTKPECRPRGERHGSRTKPECCPRGERNGRARLTVEKVNEIRTRYTAGGITLKQLASEYGVNFTSIHFIIIRRTWKHVPAV